MKFIPSCTRTTNCISLFGMPVSQASFSHKLVKPQETALPTSTHSQHTCSWNFYRCQQQWVLRVKVFEKKKWLPFLQIYGVRQMYVWFCICLLHGYIDTHLISLLKELNTQRGTGHKVVALSTVVMEHAILKRSCREVSNPNCSLSQEALFFCFIVDFRQDFSFK